MRAFFFQHSVDRSGTISPNLNTSLPMRGEEPTIPYYLTPKQDDYNQIPELQVCIVEALYDAEAVLSNPSAYKPEEIRTLRDQITFNLERAWEITGRSEDELTGVKLVEGPLLAEADVSEYHKRETLS